MDMQMRGYSSKNDQDDQRKKLQKVVSSQNLLAKEILSKLNDTVPSDEQISEHLEEIKYSLQMSILVPIESRRQMLWGNAMYYVHLLMGPVNTSYMSPLLT